MLAQFHRLRNIQIIPGGLREVHLIYEILPTGRAGPLASYLVVLLGHPDSLSVIDQCVIVGNALGGAVTELAQYTSRFLRSLVGCQNVLADNPVSTPLK
jgi:hypothetical protein